MKAFSIDELETLRARAGLMVNGVKDLLAREYDWQTTRQWVEEHLKEVFSEGYSIALDEVRSTPWEFCWCSLNIETMNDLSAKGWELLQGVVDGSVFVWRRHKAVRDLEVKASEREINADGLEAQ